MDKHKCLICGKPIVVNIFKGQGYCGEIHRKELERRVSSNGKLG